MKKTKNNNANKHFSFKTRSEMNDFISFTAVNFAKFCMNKINKEAKQ